MAPNWPSTNRSSGRQLSTRRPARKPQDEGKSPIEEADTLNHVIAKLSVLGDFFKLIGDDSFLPESDTPLGLYLIMGDCIDTLKKMGRKE